MDKKINLFLDIHSIITLEAYDLNEEVASRLHKFFGLFLTENKPGSKPDIVMTILQDVEAGVLEHKSKDPAQFWIREHKDGACIVLGYKQRPDIAIILSNPIKILYTPRPGYFGALYYAIIHGIQFALLKKNGLLYHGLVLKYNTLPMLIVGPEGIGKSPLALHMLHNGCDYLSEDKFIFLNREAYIFRPYMPIRKHHMNMFPEILTSIYNSQSKKTSKFWLRKFIEKLVGISFIKNNLPAQLHEKIKQAIDPPVFALIRDIFPNVQVLNSVHPEIAVMIINAKEQSFVEISREEFAERAKTLYWMAFPEIDNILKLLSLHGYDYHTKMNALIHRNTDNLRCFKMTLPYSSDIKQMHENFRISILSMR
ncbi:MAG: hypothetical protein HQL10_01155 [Nitrospirae bacterium]|nr:hypothetical protein [Nitrospirota bacterium]